MGDGKSDFVKTLQSIQDENPDAPYRFNFVDASKAGDFASAFEVPAGEDFSLVMMNVRKKRYARLVRSFSQMNVEDFVDNILKGKERTAKVDAIPEVFAAGKDEL